MKYVHEKSGRTQRKKKRGRIHACLKKKTDACMNKSGRINADPCMSIKKRKKKKKKSGRMKHVHEKKVDGPKI